MKKPQRKGAKSAEVRKGRQNPARRNPFGAKACLEERTTGSFHKAMLALDVGSL
jgi:hypothetical protein